MQSSMPFRISPSALTLEILWRNDNADEPTFFQALVNHGWNALPRVYFCVVDPSSQVSPLELLTFDVSCQFVHKFFVNRPVRKKNITVML
jgi:hypothetical protein